MTFLCFVFFYFYHLFRPLFLLCWFLAVPSFHLLPNNIPRLNLPPIWPQRVPFDSCLDAIEASVWCGVGIDDDGALAKYVDQDGDPYVVVCCRQDFCRRAHHLTNRTLFFVAGSFSHQNSNPVSSFTYPHGLWPTISFYYYYYDYDLICFRFDVARVVFAMILIFAVSVILSCRISFDRPGKWRIEFVRIGSVGVGAHHRLADCRLLVGGDGFVERETSKTETND